MQSSMAMAHAMGQTAKTMGVMNQAIKPQDIQKTMMEFEKQSTHMGMADEMSKYKLVVYNWYMLCGWVGACVASLVPWPNFPLTLTE